MPRLTAVNPQTATGEAKALLDGVQKSLGMTPNLIRTMASSPAVLQGYLNLSGALGNGLLPQKLREQLALAIAEANTCDYCLSAHTAIGKMIGIPEEEIRRNRRGESADPKTAAALAFARRVVEVRGLIEDADLDEVKRAGFGEGEIAEIVAHVALNTFTNYLNHVADTEVDFPRVHAEQAATAGAHRAR